IYDTIYRTVIINKKINDYGRTHPFELSGSYQKNTDILFNNEIKKGNDDSINENKLSQIISYEIRDTVQKVTQNSQITQSTDTLTSNIDNNTKEQINPSLPLSGTAKEHLSADTLGLRSVNPIANNLISLEPDS